MNVKFLEGRISNKVKENEHNFYEILPGSVSVKDKSEESQLNSYFQADMRALNPPQYPHRQIQTLIYRQQVPLFAQVSVSVYSKNFSCHNGHSSSNNYNNNNSWLHGLSASNSFSTISHQYRSQMCPVCTIVHLGHKFYSLSCSHVFCKHCWLMYFETQVFQTRSARQYQQFAFKDYVEFHPELRFSPGSNCQIIVRSREIAPKRCGMDYYVLTDCQIIKNRLTKCADDSETANYISAITKDCSKCHMCIEKNRGCKHMQCFNCKYDFCRMCLLDWKMHVSEYYECPRGYTLQYTYPYAYSTESGPRKDLFQYQQAQLEAEIENPFWKIEWAETTEVICRIKWI
uniref:RBR-type E3 ubiquitin transferase n=1 Tax=Glossina palpalis gambiensis TaxID=67801 RepID=A0A1B0BWP6_9MUSC